MSLKGSWINEIMEDKVKTSNNIHISSGLQQADKLKLDISIDMIPTSYRELSNTHIVDQDKGTNVKIANDPLSIAKVTNMCKYCRKRLATKELLNYHIVNLHRDIIPG